MQSRDLSTTSPNVTIQRAKRNGVFILLFLLLIPLLYPIWLPWIGEFLVVADQLQKTDALVVLAGDENERIVSGAELFHQGFASWFVLTDMRLEIPNSYGFYGANVKRKTVSNGVPAERILIVPGQVSSTEEEVLRLKEFAISQRFHSLIVITSPFHTRRARMILREAFRGSGINLVVYPAKDYPYQANRWWQNSLHRNLTILEYGKILAHLLGCRESAGCGPSHQAWLKTWQYKFLNE